MRQQDLINKGRIVVKTATMILAMGLVPSCGDDSSSSPTFTRVWNEIYTDKNCASCHSGTDGERDNGLGLDLTTQALAYTNTVGKTVGSLNSASNCASLQFVKTSAATESVLYGSLDESAVAGFAELADGCEPNYSEHSANSVTLSAAQLSLLKSWINAGALND